MTVTNEAENVIDVRAKMKREAAANASSPIRIKMQTRTKLDVLLKRANKNHFGRKVKPDDLICCALDLLESKHLDEIRDGVLTNKDRFDLLYRQSQKSNRNLSRDQFIGMLLEGKIKGTATE